MSQKVNPTSKSVNPAAPARMGVMLGNHATGDGKVNVQHVPIYRGRGLEAPMVGTTRHPKGSQGSH